MNIAIWILLALVILLVITAYSLCVIAHQSDERAERMYRKWKEQLDYDMHNNGEDLDSDYNIGINHAMCVIEAMKGADDERDYERAIEQMEHDMLYEPTYNPEDGSM